MQVAFAGTPEFASQALEALLDAGYSIPLVLTQPDRPSGRGLRMTPSAVKQVALRAGLPLIQPRSLRLDGRFAQDAQEARQALQAAQPDVLIVAAYGLILPPWVLELPALGCLNIHASLLPRWRGAAPIQRAIEAGDEHTGITIMQMDEGLDTGDILLSKAMAILPHHTSALLHDDLAQLGAGAIVEALAALRQGALLPTPQPTEGVTYAHKLERSEAALDFSASASELERRIRAFQPFPGTTMQLPGIETPVKVWKAQVLDTAPQARAPGDIIAVGPKGIDVATGAGVLRVLELQRAGGRRQAVAAFIQGWAL